MNRVALKKLLLLGDDSNSDSLVDDQYWFKPLKFSQRFQWFIVAYDSVVVPGSELVLFGSCSYLYVVLKILILVDHLRNIDLSVNFDV